MPGKKKEENRDVLVVLSDNGMADICYVEDVNSERIIANTGDFEDRGYNVPIADVKAYTGRSGRVFVLGGTGEYVSEVARLAELEKSTVLASITNYGARKAPKTIDWNRIFMAGMVFILLMAVIFK